MPVYEFVAVGGFDQLDIGLERRSKAEAEEYGMGFIFNLKFLAEVLREWSMPWEDVTSQNDLCNVLKGGFTAAARLRGSFSLSSPILDASAAVDGMISTIALE